jgi:hypothetical protein
LAASIALWAKRWYTAQGAVDFEIVGGITAIETIASGHSVYDLQRLQRRYGKGRWRKRKGVARVKLLDGTVHAAEIHSYEAHGIGRREYKLKLPLID